MLEVSFQFLILTFCQTLFISTLFGRILPEYWRAFLHFFVSKAFMWSSTSRRRQSGGLSKGTSMPLWALIYEHSFYIQVTQPIYTIDISLWVLHSIWDFCAYSLCESKRKTTSFSKSREPKSKGPAPVVVCAVRAVFQDIWFQISGCIYLPHTFGAQSTEHRTTYD